MQLQHVSEEGVLAKSDIAYPKLTHSERSELVGPIPQPATEHELGGQRQKAAIDAFS